MFLGWLTWTLNLTWLTELFKISKKWGIDTNAHLVAKDAIASNNPIQRVGHISRYLQRRYLLPSQIKGQLW